MFLVVDKKIEGLKNGAGEKNFVQSSERHLK